MQSIQILLNKIIKQMLQNIILYIFYICLLNVNRWVLKASLKFNITRLFLYISRNYKGSWQSDR